jgi:hypothetical protein
MRKHRVLIILWPAFLMAGVLEMLVFALVNPSDLHGLGVEALGWSNQTIYTLAFFVFWAVIGAAGAMTWLLHQTEDAINTQSFR